MNILLVGEYSGLHNNLKNGLLSLGHKVTLLNYGDSWKKFKTDINLKNNVFWPLNIFLDEVNFKLFIVSRQLKKTNKYDVVQFINPLITNTRLQILFRNLHINNYIVKNLISCGKCSALLGAGDDHYYFKAIEDEMFEYNPISETEKYDMNWLRNLYSQWWKNPLLRLWNIEMVKLVNGVIPCSYSYSQGYNKYVPDKTLPDIAFPIDLEKTQYVGNNITDGSIQVMHGLSRSGFKGSNVIKEAFTILKKKYPEHSFIIYDKLPYIEYIKLLRSTNILVDQLNSYSYGMNALLGLSMGKIVISGCEDVIKRQDGFGTCRGLINSKPNTTYLVKIIENIILNREQFSEIGLESRNYVKKYHSASVIAEKYINEWRKL